jgi:flagellar protein FliS
MNLDYAMHDQKDVNTYNPVNDPNPMKIILMLYEGALNFLKQAVAYGEEGDIKNKNIYTNKARDIIIGLNSVLDMESGGEIAKTLRSLYFFMARHLMEADLNNDLNGLHDVIGLLTDLQEGWNEIADMGPGNMNKIEALTFS